MLKNSGEILYTKGKNDECYTPRNAVALVLEFLEPFRDKIIWCPFDTCDSQFVKVLTEKGFNVVYSHLNTGQDFYEYEPKDWDLIVSNPPFTNKRKIFERCIKFEKPFCLLMSMVWLNDTAPFEVFGEYLQLLAINGRVEYLDANGICMGRPSFASGYYCKDFLPKTLCVRKL